VTDANHNEKSTCDDAELQQPKKRPTPLLPADQNAPASPEKTTKKRGAPKGNSNATTSGLRGSKLPKAARSEEIKLHSLRALLRRLAAQEGQQSDATELTIQAALRHETTALLALRWLRLESEGMGIDTRLNLLATVAKATEARDRAIARLGIGGPSADSERDIYADLAKQIDQGRAG
jgi:hypothetical protein